MYISDYFREFVLPSNLYTNYRVIPSIDGLKNTQRKIIYVMKDSKDEDKVANKAALISSKTSYLHGTQSLSQTLSSLNVKYPGSGNNLCIFTSNGQFSSKACAGEGIGADRYVYTNKNFLFDKIYRSEDIAILETQSFEDQNIESKHMLPVLIPLYNIQYSIGSGFASYLLPRDPEKLIKYMKQYLNNEEKDVMLLHPYIKGFYGEITKNSESANSYTCYGKWEKNSANQLTITEIKPFCSLETYLKFLDKLVDEKIIKSYRDESTSTKFKFILNVPSVFFEKNNTELKMQKALMLTESMNENLTMFDENNKIKVYENVEEYIEHFINWRLKKYSERHAYYIKKFQSDQDILSEKARFIKAVVEKELVLNNMPKEQILSWLSSHEFKLGEELLKLPLYNITKEKYEELLKQVEQKQKELDEYKKETPISLWLKDLAELEVAIDQYNKEWDKEFNK